MALKPVVNLSIQTKNKILFLQLKEKSRIITIFGSFIIDKKM